MFYIINNMVVGGDISGLPSPTDTIDDEVWKLYSKNPSFYKIENGKFIKIKDESELRADAIRARREIECFPIINRGALWYEKLSEAQKTELAAWYQAWLDAPQTNNAPEMLEWVNEV